MQAQLLLAVTAGMLGAVNPCGFALLPAYLSVLLASDSARPDRPRAVAAAVGRAVACTTALTTGYVAVFGAVGMVLAPVTGWLQPRLPWLTVVLGLGLLAAGVALLAGRRLPSPGAGLRAPRLTGSPASMVLFGMAYALASVGCAIGPFLAIVVSSLRAGSPLRGLALFVAYAAGMGLVIGVTAVAVALVRVSAVSRLRRASAVVPRLGGAVLVATGGYVAYYGGYELRLHLDPRSVGRDPVVGVAGDLQHRLAGLVGEVGAGRLLLVFAALLAVALVSMRVRTHRRSDGTPTAAAAQTAAARTAAARTAAAQTAAAPVSGGVR